MASHSTREGKRPSSPLKSSARAREAQETNGPRRMALSERMDAGESKGMTPAPKKDALIAGNQSTLHELAMRRRR